MTKEEQKQYEYHKAREDTHFLKKIKEDEKLNKEIGKAYQRAYDNIQAEIDGWIGKYAAFENISIEEARKRVSNLDVKAFERKAKRYVEEREFSKRANEELRLYNLTMKVNRQELLKRNIGLELIGLADTEDKILRKKLLKLGEEELTRQAGILGMGAAQKERMSRGIGKVVDGDFHSATFSDRIWANQSALRRKLEDGIDRTILRGENPTVWARKLRHEVGESFKHAKLASERIAVTESARVQVQIATKSFEDMGYEQMVVICEPGACHICKPHDQEIVSVEEVQMGKNIPLWHPYCRCSVAAWMSRERLDDKIDGRKHMSYQSYDEIYNQEKTTSPYPPYNKHNKISKEKRRELNELAKSHNIELMNIRNFDGDPELLKDFINGAAEVLDLFPEIEFKNREYLVMSFREMDDYVDYAVTEDKRFIFFNSKLFRNVEYFKNEYNDYVENGYFPKGTNYKHVAYHETAHFVEAELGIDSLKIATEITGLSENGTIKYLKENISIYSGTYADGTEVFPEIVSDYFGENPKHFTLHFMEKVLRLRKGGI